MSDSSERGRNEGGGGDHAPGQQRWKASPSYPQRSAMRLGQSKSLETPAAAASQDEGAANAGDSGRGTERAESAGRVAVLRPQTSFGDGMEKPKRKISDDNSAAGVGVVWSLGHEQWAAAGLSEDSRDEEIGLGPFAVETAQGTKTSIWGAERVRSKHDESGLSGKEPFPEGTSLNPIDLPERDAEDSQPASGVQECSLRVATASKEKAEDSVRAPAAMRTDTFQSPRQVVPNKGDVTESLPLPAKYSSKCVPKPGDGSSVVGASARVAPRHRAIVPPPIAGTSSAVAYPLDGKVTHKELLPSLPSATGVSGARPKLALRRTESSLSGKWAPTGATRLDRRISAREAAERIRRSNVVGDKSLRNGAQPKKARPWVPPGAAQGFAGTRKGKSSKPIVSSVRGRKKDVRGLAAEENDETSAGAKGACRTGSLSGTAPKRDPAKREAADARQRLRAMTSVLPGQGKNTIVEGLQVDEMVETRGDADGAPAASSSAIVAVKSDATKRDAAGAIEESSIMEIVSYGQGRKELVGGSPSKETSESRFGKYFVRSTGEIPGAVGEGDVAAIDAAKREVTNALGLSPSLKNTSSIRGRKEVVRSPSTEPKAEMRGRADAFCPSDRSPGAAAKSDAAKRDAADSKEGAPGMMNVSLARGRTEFPWGPLAEEASERRGYADSVPSARSSPFVTAKSDVVSHAAVTLEGSQAMKSLSPMRGQKEVVRRHATEEMAETRDGGPGYVRATGSSSYDVANNDGAAREAVDAIEYWSALKSLSSVRVRKTVVRKPLADKMPMMKGDFDGSRPTDRSSAAPKSDARERDAACVTDFSRGMESISPSRGSKKVAQRPRAKEIVEMSDASGAPAASSSSGVAATSDGSKLYTADAREGSTGMTTVSYPRGNKRAVRGSSAEDKAEARAGAYDVRGSGGLVSAPSTSDADERDAENSSERPPFPKDVRPGRKRKKIREAPTEEVVGVRSVPGSIHAISRSSSVAPTSGAAKRDSADPRDEPPTTKSVPRGRSTKKVRRGRPTKEDIAIRGGTDSARAIGTSAGAAVKDDAAKRQTADANERSPVVDSVSLGRGNKKGIRNKPRDGKAEKRDCVGDPSAAAIRDLVYAAGLSPEKKRAPPRRMRKKIDRGPPAEGDTETVSNADGTSATGSSRSAAPKNAAAKRGSAKVRPLAKKSIPSVRGRKRVRKPPIEDHVEMRDGAAGAQGTLRSSSPAAKSVAPKSDSPMRASSKRNAADNIEGLTAKKSVPPGRGRKKGREVSPKLRSPDAHLDFMRSLAPEPPRHGVLSAPTPSLFLPTDSDGKPAVPRERAANSAWDLEHFVALPDEKEAEAELVATGKRCHEVEDGVVEGDGRKVDGKGEARVTAGGSSFPSERSIDMDGGMEEDPVTTLKDLQDAILNTLHEAKPNDQKNLFEPQEYGELGGYFEGVQQPFEIMVHPNVRFVADIHSYHMEKAEVIGVLAGRLDREKRVLYIQAAIPVKEATMPCGHRGHTEVEMDPVWSLNVNERIRSLGMQMVGWYHSHPKFKNIPSLIDVQNQGAFQAQFESDSGNPWVGMIVGRNHSPSDFLFFRNESVSRENREPVACPMLLRTRLLSSTFSTAALAAAAAVTNATMTPPSPETQASQEKDSCGGPTAAAACKTRTHVRDEDFTSAAFPTSLALLPPPPPLAAAPSPAPTAEPTPQGVKESPPELSPQVMTAAPTRAPCPLNGLNASVGGGSTEAPAFGVAKFFGAPQQGVEGGAYVQCAEARGVEREALQKGAGMLPAGAGGGIGASWAGGRHNLVAGDWARMQARVVERAEVARADATRRMRKTRLLAERGNGDAIAPNDAVASVVGSPSPADNGRSSPFGRVGMASVHLDEAIGGRRAGMAPTPGKGGHHGLAPRVPVQGFPMESSTHGVEPEVSVESCSVRSLKMRDLGEEEAAAAAARSVVAAAATRFAGESSPLGHSVQGSGASSDDRRERLFSAISTIARDPPLIFSDEVACVLKGREVVCAWAGGGGVEHDIGDDSGSVGEIVRGYGPEMDYAIDSLMCLGRYYARVSGRAKWWGSRGTPALEKLARSLAETVDHMELCPSETDEFVQDACTFLSACFRETNVPRRRKGTAQKRAASEGAVKPCPKRARKSVCRDS